MVSCSLTTCVLVINFPAHTHLDPVEISENYSERSPSVSSEGTLLSDREKTPANSECAFSVLNMA